MILSAARKRTEMISRIKLDSSVCRDFAQSSRREWLETNGRGGYASGTVSGANTRRYHGLLIASLKPPVERYVLLANLEETVMVGQQHYELACNQYPQTVHPQGFQYIEEFKLAPFPTWTYNVAGVTIQKVLAMVYGENTTLISYELLNPEESPFAVLALRPMLAFRDYHSLTVKNDSLQTAPQREEPGLLELCPYSGLPPIRLLHNGAGFTQSPDWYRQFEYTQELERGLDYREDLFSPGYFSFLLNAEQPRAYVVATLDRSEMRGLSMLDEVLEGEAARRRRLVVPVNTTDPFVEDLSMAADHFIVTRADGASSVIAGYHWFTDWGRDTMIALPGLTLATRRFDLAKEILGSFLKFINQGMLPNRFPDHGEEPAYNTVDATLWLFHVVREYLLATGDEAFVRQEAFHKLEEVIEWHIQGTRYHIGMDPSDSLLAAGSEGAQLTWMDAKIGDWVVTPRHGKPVEVNALWHHAMRVMEDLSARFSEPAKAKYFGALADRIRESFNAVFWNPEAACLYDAVNGDDRDSKIRPNQIFAVSLPFPLLPAERARSVVRVVEEHLLTPYGLRSLSPSNRDYKGVYRGGVYERDSAYHQGTVWPWLIGPFVDACLNVEGPSPAVRERLLQLFEPLKAHRQEALLGSISEIFDAEPPHLPKGCAAQAWSVAEVLRAYRRLSEGQI
ncbi:MAG: amylo-alpha-1,6-glucosidase [Acidobacteriota bacterium]